MPENRQDMPARSGVNNFFLSIPVVRWFRDYWYYYKTYILMGLFFVLLIGGVLFSVFTKEKTDFTVAFLSQVGIENEESARLAENFARYLPDIDGNGKVRIGVTSAQIGVSLSDEFSVAAYDTLTTMLIFDEVVFMLVDEYSARYLAEIQALEPLSVLGIRGGEDAYSVKVTGTPLLEGTSVGEYIDFYIVVKRFSEAESGDARYLARREAIRPMLEEVLP